MKNKYVNHTDYHRCIYCGDVSNILAPINLPVSFSKDICIPLCNYCRETLDAKGYTDKEWRFFFNTVEDLELYIENNYIVRNFIMW